MKYYLSVHLCVRVVVWYIKCFPAMYIPRLETLSPSNNASSSGSLSYVSADGTPVYQIFEHYPSLRWLYPFHWERNADISQFVTFARDYLWLGWVVVLVYVVCVGASNRLLQNKRTKQSVNSAAGVPTPRPAPSGYCLKTALILWNLILAIVSGIATFRIVPELVFRKMHQGAFWTDVILENGEYFGGQGASGFWVMMFVYLKFAELLDTAFLMLRRRPVTFLHWYHHVTVLLYCWRSYADRPAIGVLLGALNFFVHTVMYFYYFLTALGYRPTWNKLVTVLQIVQMMIGVVICAYVTFLRFLDHPVITEDRIQRTNTTYYYGTLMYGSYLVLFISFFVRRYGPCQGTKRKAA